LALPEMGVEIVTRDLEVEPISPHLIRLCGLSEDTSSWKEVLMAAGAARAAVVDRQVIR
jgi:hypothetical protein